MFVGGKIKDVPKEVKFKRKNHGSQTSETEKKWQIYNSKLSEAQTGGQKYFLEQFVTLFYSFRTETHLSYTR